MRLTLELVRERLERGLGALVGECLLEDAVGEPRVAWEQRAVQVRAVRAPVAAAFESRGAVVPEPARHPPERLRSLVEDRAPGVVLEPRERLAGPVALEQDVADHAALAG